MGNLEPFDQKRTKWSGLWYHSDTHSFSSPTFSLAELRKFKGRVRLIVRKNRFYNDGENGRPNYVFIFADSKNEKYFDMEVVEDTDIRTNNSRNQGNWEPVYDPLYRGCVTGYKCDVCGENFNEQTNYCPNCGAEM